MFHCSLGSFSRKPTSASNQPILTSGLASRTHCPRPRPRTWSSRPKPIKGSGVWSQIQSFSKVVFGSYRKQSIHSSTESYVVVTRHNAYCTWDTPSQRAFCLPNVHNVDGCLLAVTAEVTGPAYKNLLEQRHRCLICRVIPQSQPRIHSWRVRPEFNEVEVGLFHHCCSSRQVQQQIM